MGNKADNPGLQARMITPTARGAFRDLIAADVYADMKAGLPVTAIGLTDNSEPVGAIAGILTDAKMFEVRSLYVDPDHRRKGGATMLTSALEKILDLRDALAVISYVEDNEETEALTAFMESRLCVLENGLERLYRGTVEAFLGSGLFTKGYKSRDIRSFSGFDKAVVNTIKKKLPQIISECDIPLMSSCRIAPELSFAAVSKDGIAGILLAGYQKNNPKEPMVILSEDAPPRIIGGLLNSFFSACSEELDTDTGIRFPVANDRLDQMMGRIEGVKNIQHNYLF